MKIAIASNNGVNVSGHLGRCKSFIVYETNDKEIIKKETRENTFRHHESGHGNHDHQHDHQGGHSREHGEGEHNHNALIEILKDCDYVIFQSGGWRVIEDLQANNITPMLTDEENAEAAAKKLLAGELETKDENTCRNH